MVLWRSGYAAVCKTAYTGSIPVGTSKTFQKFKNCAIIYIQRANVAQLFRALPCQGRGRELESLHSHHIHKLHVSFCCWLTLALRVES